MRNDKEWTKSGRDEEIANKKTWKYEEEEVIIGRRLSNMKFKTNKGKSGIYKNTIVASSAFIFCYTKVDNHFGSNWLEITYYLILSKSIWNDYLFF